MSGYWEAAAKAVGAWDLQEASGQTAVDSVGSRDGTLLNGLDFASDAAVGPTGWLPSALALSASNHGVQIAYDSTINGATYTTHAWARWDGGGTPYGTVWSSRSSSPALSGHLLYKTSADQWSHWFGDGGPAWQAYGTEPSLTEWVFLAVTYDGTASRLYIDGAQVAVDNGSGYVANSVEPWMIGNRADLTVGFSGEIAGFALYDEALTAAEIAEIYQGPEPTSLSPPAFLGSVVVGAPVTISPGSWDGHNNGVSEFQQTLQQSDDGVTGWSLVESPIGDPGGSLPPSMAGKYLRVEAIATNSGGSSDAASSGVYQVGAARTPMRMAAGGVHSDHANSREVVARTSTAGLVVPVETV